MECLTQLGIHQRSQLSLSAMPLLLKHLEPPGEGIRPYTRTSLPREAAKILQMPVIRAYQALHNLILAPQERLSFKSG